MNYTKLSDVQKFIIKKYNGFKYKKWDQDNKKMLIADNWQDGYRKMHSFEVFNGAENLLLDLSDSQVGQILAKAMKNSWLDEAKVEVKTNGKEGMDIRYFLNFHGFNSQEDDLMEDEETYAEHYNNLKR